MADADEPWRRRLRRAAGRRWVQVVAGALVALLLAAGAGGWWLQRQINPPGSPGAVVEVEIPDGSSARAVAEILDDAGVISSATVFRFYVRVKGEDGFLAGRYTFQEDMTFGDVIDLLQAGPELAFDRVTVPEGFTVEQVAERVGSLARLEAATFLELATSGAVRSTFQPPGVTTLEGLILPETYFVDDTEDEQALLARMVQALDDAASGLGYADAGARVGLTPYETIIVASLIEREARVPEDRAKISRVIHNRLARGMRLEIDATVLYALGEHKERVLFRDLEVDSPYNTYRMVGLPPTPIAAPGRAALEAALDPADGAWLYYVVVEESGAHAFAETFSEHQANIREAERRGVR